MLTRSQKGVFLVYKTVIWLYASTGKRNRKCFSERFRFTTHRIMFPKILAATAVFECGVEGKVIQQLLGHTNIATTMNIYTDIFSDQQQEKIVLIDQFLTPKLTPIET